MYQRIISRLVFFIAFLAQVSVGAQENEIKYIYYHELNPEAVTAINFVNKKSNLIISTFDVIKNNPYNSLKYPVIGEKFKNKIYTINKILSKDIQYFVSNKSSKIIDFELAKASSQVVVMTSDKNYTTVSYILLVSSTEELMDFHTTTIILDNNGKIIKTFEHLNCRGNNAIVSQDGKFFLLSDYGDAYDGKFNQSHRIYDIKTGQIVYEEERSGFDQNLSLWSLQNGIFVREEIISAEENTITILDFEKNYKINFNQNRNDTFTQKELLKIVFSVREDISNNKAINSTFSIEQFNFYQKK